MKQIIVPTDFSDNAFNAFTSAIRYFAQDHVRFSVVHIYKKTQDDQPQLFNGKLDHLLDRVSQLKRRSHHIFETYLLEGDLLTRLQELVISENTDLIVMGTHGRTADRKVSLGSNTLQVIKQVSCPVLAIPPDADVDTPKRLLFPTRLQAALVDRELQLLQQINKWHDAHIQLLHINSLDHMTAVEQEVRSLLESRFGESEISYHHHNQQESHAVIHNLLNNFIRENHIDLLVLVNSKNSFLESYIQQSAIESLGLHLTIPFLILQNIQR